MILHIAAGGLGVEPFAHIALGAAGAAGQFSRADRPGAGHGFVEPELVAKADHDAAIAGGQIADGLTDEVVETLLIDGHCSLLGV